MVRECTQLSLDILSCVNIMNRIVLIFATNALAMFQHHSVSPYELAHAKEGHSNDVRAGMWLVPRWFMGKMRNI